MRARARVVTLMVVGGLIGLPGSASAQDNASCVVYPQLCPPQNPQNPPGNPTQGQGTTSTGGPAATPAQAVQDQPPISDGDRVGGGGRQDQGDGGGGAGREVGRGAPEARRPITVNLRRGAGGPGRCFYAIVHVGRTVLDLERLATRTLGRPCYIRTLREPVQIDRLRALLGDTPYADVGTDEDGREELQRLAIAVGEQLATPETLSPAVDDVLFIRRIRELRRVSGVVITHDPKPLKGDQDSIRDRVANSLVRGMREAQIPASNGGLMPIPVVGVEETTTEPSQIPWFKSRKVSSVDNLDQRVGRRALSLLMSGGKPGHYGVKKTAEALLPQPNATAAPVRFRTAGAVGSPADTASGIGAGTALMAALLALTAGWSLGLAGRRTLRRRVARARR